jgi:cell division transport system permease protein
MIALTVLAAAGGFALGNLADTARSDLSGGLTVQIIEADQDLLARQTRQAEDLLKNDPAVQSLRAVPAQELSALLEPWLGSMEADSNSIPMPALIDVQLRNAADPSEVARLASELSAIIPSARVDAQSDWLKPVYSALSALQYLAAILIALLALTSAAAVWLAARSAFTAHRETIEIVHHLGGTDEQIARIFQSSVAFDAILGGLIGLAAGLLGIWIIGSRFAGLDSGMVESGGLDSVDWVFIAAIPFTGIAIAMLTARLTVMSALRRML